LPSRVRASAPRRQDPLARAIGCQEGDLIKDAVSNEKKCPAQTPLRIAAGDDAAPLLSIILAEATYFR
jgi:hypothetical protein